MKKSNSSKDYKFEEIKSALLDTSKPFPPGALYFFSDISPQDLALVSEVWPTVYTERRRGLLEDMENLAEGDTLLFFDHMAVMCLSDQDPLARATAIRLLWQSEDEDLVPVLMKMLQEDTDVIVRAAAATALGSFVQLGELEEISEETYNLLLKRLIQTHTGSDETLVRRRSLEALGYASHPDVAGFIQDAYDTDDEDWLQSALFAMGRTYDRRWIECVMTMMDHPENMVRVEAIRAAGELEAKGAREALFDLLEEGTDDIELYFAAIWALSKIGGQGVRRLIEMNLEETDDLDEIAFLEEALANLDFTEQVSQFDLLVVDEDQPEEWEAGDDYYVDDDEDLPYAW
jgi:HEAT repeat protein